MFFRKRTGPVHDARRKHFYCSRTCQNTTHGLSGTKRHVIWEGARARSKKNGVIFALALEDIPEIPKNCPVLGIRIVANTVAGPLDSSPSLDRIDRKLGYVKGNVRIISNRANRLRSDGTAEELERIAKDAKRLARRRIDEATGELFAKRD